MFYAWEFGANLGHIGPFLPLGRALRDAGHTVHWAVAQTGPAARVLDREGFTWMQAPLAAELKVERPPLSYADILLRFGYADRDDLLGLVVAWRELFIARDAQLVLADHAPTAVLAARSLGLPVMLFSNGFTVPPRVRPLPVLRPWQPLPAETLLALEDQALSSVNAVLQRFEQPPIDALARLFDVAEEALITYPELDHYAQRGPARYWGALPNAAIGAAPPWPQGEGPRIFAYLRPEVPHCEAVLDALKAAAVPTAIYFPGLAAEARSRWQAPHLVFMEQPADLARTAAEADLAVTYASLAATTAFLLAGKPLLLLPSQLEQYLLASRVGEMGAGLLVNPEEPAGDLLPAIRALSQMPSYAENARAFAAKYAAFGQEKVIANLVKRIEELCAESEHEQR
ncbi:MAG TPA: hypothetical protein VI279_16755 [Rhodocyclaceae bacterium]